mmetsp:Transcript_9859/g.14534  ORF Transcript_9859/g.14534 Transcript_9859/m.14534 type:complete len:542 (+) Transcript_9859:130-1755(+)
MKRPKSSSGNRKKLKPIDMESRGPSTDMPVSPSKKSSNRKKRKVPKRSKTPSYLSKSLKNGLNQAHHDTEPIQVDDLPPPSFYQSDLLTSIPPIFGTTKSKPHVIYETNELSVSRMRALEKGLVRQLEEANVDKLRMAAMLREQEETIRILRQEDIQSYYQEQVRELKTYIQELKSVIEDDKVIQQQLKDRVLEQQDELLVVTKERNQLETDLNQSRSDHRLAVDELTTRTEQLNDLKERHAVVAKKLEERVTQINSLRATRGSLSSMIKKIRAENQDMQAKYGLFDKQIELLMRDNRKLEYENEDLKAKVSNVKPQQTSFSAVVSETVSDLANDMTYDDDEDNQPSFSNALFVGDEMNISNADLTVRRFSLNSGSWQTAIADFPINDIFTFSVQLDDIRSDGEIKIGVVQPDSIHVHTQDIGEVRGGWCLYVGDGQIYHHSNCLDIHQPEDDVNDVDDVDSMNIDDVDAFLQSSTEVLSSDYEFMNDDIIKVVVNIPDGHLTIYVNESILGRVYMNVSSPVYPAISLSGDDNYQVSFYLS